MKLTFLSDYWDADKKIRYAYLTEPYHTLINLRLPKTSHKLDIYQTLENTLCRGLIWLTIKEGRWNV